MIPGRQFAGAQVVGGRPYQEDHFQLVHVAAESDTRPDGLLLVLADGMGGQKGGKQASTLAVKAFVKAFAANNVAVPARLSLGLEAATGAIGGYVADNPDFEGMGCTLVAAVLTKGELQWISVGDSPMWLLRDGRLQRLNADHSLRPVLLEKLTPEEVARHPERNVLRSAVMGERPDLIDLRDKPVEIRQGDRLVLASDGLQTLHDAEIESLLTRPGWRSAEQDVADLIAAVEARQKKGQDNTTVLILNPDPPGVEIATPPMAGTTPSKNRAALIAGIVGLCLVSAFGGWLAAGSPKVSAVLERLLGREAPPAPKVDDTVKKPEPAPVTPPPEPKIEPPPPPPPVKVEPLKPEHKEQPAKPVVKEPPAKPEHKPTVKPVPKEPPPKPQPKVEPEQPVQPETPPEPEPRPPEAPEAR